MYCAITELRSWRRRNILDLKRKIKDFVIKWWCKLHVWCCILHHKCYDLHVRYYHYCCYNLHSVDICHAVRVSQVGELSQTVFLCTLHLPTAGTVTVGVTRVLARWRTRTLHTVIPNLTRSGAQLGRGQGRQVGVYKREQHGIRAVQGNRAALVHMGFVVHLR